MGYERRKSSEAVRPVRMVHMYSSSAAAYPSTPLTRQGLTLVDESLNTHEHEGGQTQDGDGVYSRTHLTPPTSPRTRTPRHRTSLPSKIKLMTVSYTHSPFLYTHFAD